MERKQHWATRPYHRFLIAGARTKFKWGEWDCATFAAKGIRAMTGVDIADDFRGLYHDEASAMAAIEKVTGVKGGTIEDAAMYCANKHGLVEWEYPLMAQRGDLVVLEESGRLICGLVHLNGRHIVAAGEQGLKRLPITAVKRAWHHG
jgi:hypothetical protein